MKILYKTIAINSIYLSTSLRLLTPTINYVVNEIDCNIILETGTFMILHRFCKYQPSEIMVQYLMYLCVGKIMSPQWSNLILSTNIPDSKANILIFNSFDIKA
jgi:hypothetical protein